MESLGCPGCGQIGPLTLRPLLSISTTSPVTSPRLAAVAGLTRTALSQQRFVIGFGVSCSQALLARLPSYTIGSRRKMTSISPPALLAARIAPPFADRLLAGNAVFATKPSCTALRHATS